MNTFMQAASSRPEGRTAGAMQEKVRCVYTGGVWQASYSVC